MRRPNLPTDVPRDVFTMAGVAFCVALGFGIVAPAIPLFAEQFGMDASAAGAVVSAFALLRLICGPVSGKLVDVLGVRTALLIGLVVVGVSSLLAGLAESYDQLLILRGVGGAGSAIFGVAAMSVVLRAATEHTRGRAMSIYRSGFLTGGIAGPAVGGAVLGWSLRAPFFIYAGSLALSGAVAMMFLARPRPAVSKAAPAAAERDTADPALLDECSPEATDRPEPVERPAAGPPDAKAQGLVDALKTREYQAALTSNLAIGLTVLGLRSTIVPLFIVNAVGASAGWVGIAFLVSALVETALMFPAGRWSDIVGRRVPLVLGAFVTAGGLLVLDIGRNLVIVMLAMAVLGAGSAFLGPVGGALVGDVIKGSGSTIIAVFNMANDAGKVIGPVLAGWLVDRGSFGAAFGFGAAVLVLAGVSGLRLPRRMPVTSRS